MYKQLLTGTFILMLGLIASCSRQNEEISVPEIEAPSISEETLTEAGTQLWNQSGLVIEKHIEMVELLDSAIKQFIATPSEETHQTAKKQWRELDQVNSDFYLISQLAENAPPALTSFKSLNYRLFAAPIQPGYLDSFGEYLYSGLVHDIGLPITPETLGNQHGFADEESATLGLYAIEFMLFGDDGQRQYSDYVESLKLTPDEIEKGYKLLAETPNNRRRQLLELQSQLLVMDFNQLAEQWNSQKKDDLNRKYYLLDNTEKQAWVSQTLEKSLTNLILDISEQKQRADQGEENSTWAPRMLNKISSLLPALSFLPKEQKSLVEPSLNKAIESCNQTTEIKWDDLYNSIKGAVDSFHQLDQ
ncbi:imelysin family protein [Teredinibacter sp. KSP-S5-2]|uniref:imelysin family protein n=1 Tax=Teredinibacter sp. KSP-S5-2 TaxID=3034506 RepID=UPI002934A5DE|nr:imelysin family protein [Teredinibacter sp. KSP-S5-2]WNO08870.1 imelysin family protein [Teredinibacter sp. KSP-S5-2]